MSKYNSRKATYNGIIFTSKKEAQRYAELKMLQDAGAISDLQLQKKYELIPSQRINGKVVERACNYIADFVYIQDGETVVEDVKGYRRSKAYDLYVIKRKLMLYKYGVRIREI